MGASHATSRTAIVDPSTQSAVGQIPPNPEESRSRHRWRDFCTKKNVWAYIKSVIPILDWLPRYKCREYLIPDLFAGVTLAFLNVPQAFAFSTLANAPLMSGLYTACFSSFVYALLGVAQISSYGPVAVGAMLTGESVAIYMHELNKSSEYGDRSVIDYDRVSFIATLTFTMGLIYLCFFLVQLSAINILFTKAFISGFVSGCCVHILIKALKPVLGVQVESHYGYFTVYKNARDLALKVPNTHIPTLILSLAVISILLLNTFLLKKLLAKVTKLILPIEMIVMMVAIFVSYYSKFGKHGVDVVGSIPAGLPHYWPLTPSLLTRVFLPALEIATVNYAISIVMVITFNKHGINTNQETLAMAVSNLICSNFECITIGNSVLRTMIALELGIKTQLATIISSAILFLVLLFAGPLFEPLPVAVIGCIILVSIGNLLVTNIIYSPRIFKISIQDGIIWVIVFLATASVNMSIGLAVGFLLTLRQLLVRVTIDDEEKRRKERELNQAIEQIPIGRQ